MACTDFATLADLTLYYPDLVAAVDPAIVADKLECSECKFNAAKWGCHLREGHMAYVVHCLKMYNGGTGTTTPGSTAGVITSMTQGPVSVGFGQTSSSGSDSAWLSQTPEGQKYMELRRSVGVGCGARIRGGGNCSRGRIASFY